MAQIVGITGVSTSINISGTYVDTFSYTKDGEVIEFKHGVTTVGKSFVNPFETMTLKAWVTSGSAINALDRGEFYALTTTVIPDASGTGWRCTKFGVEESTGQATFISVDGERYPSITP